MTTDYDTGRGVDCNRPPLEGMIDIMGRLDRLKRVATRLSETAKHYDTGLPRVAARAAHLKLTRDIGLARAIFLGMLDPAISDEDLASHIAMKDFWGVLDTLNRGSDTLLADKAMFYDHCRGYDLQIPELYAVAHAPFAWTPDHRTIHTDNEWNRFVREELPERFLIKPALADHGHGIVAYTREKNELVLNDEKRAPLNELKEHLFEDGTKHVIQQRIRCHPTLEKWTGHQTAQCVRLVTIVNRSGEVAVWAAALRLVRSGGVTDNFSKGLSGNLFCMVNLSDGTLREVYVSTSSSVGMVTIAEHPETGQALIGLEVPLFDDVVALGKRAALEFLPLRAIGWDIAITPDGPMLLEGNSVWGAMSSERPWLTRDALAELASLA